MIYVFEFGDNDCNFFTYADSEIAENFSFGLIDYHAKLLFIYNIQAISL